MRTTVDLDDDVEAAVTALQRERGMGRSQVLNELARRGDANTLLYAIDSTSPPHAAALSGSSRR